MTSKEFVETLIFALKEKSQDYIIDKDLLKEIVPKLKNDLEVLEILKQNAIYRPSFYLNQAQWGSETIFMNMDAVWGNKEDFEKVKEWLNNE